MMVNLIKFSPTQFSSGVAGDTAAMRSYDLIPSMQDVTT